jgi:hypothetical protein
MPTFVVDRAPWLREVLEDMGLRCEGVLSMTLGGVYVFIV